MSTRVKWWTSSYFLTFFSNLESCLISMKGCGSSQHWAWELEKLEHKVRLMQGRLVKAFVMGNKNDVMDAHAIWMAVQQHGKAIAVKIEEQQSVLVLHRSRRQLPRRSMFFTGRCWSSAKPSTKVGQR